MAHDAGAQPAWTMGASNISIQPGWNCVASQPAHLNPTGADRLQE